jgi:membrane protein YqaA with SNARE-associated domain
MSICVDGRAGKFSDVFKVSWVRSSIFRGAILAAIGIAAIFILKVLNVGETWLFLGAKAFIKEYGLLGIFLATIIAGTIVPLGSPALVVAAASFGLHPLSLAMVAAIGFTIGMTINYSLAYSLGRPYFMKKIGRDKLDEIEFLWTKWGWIIYAVFGLLPFLPIELLSLLCGVLKTNLGVFLILTFTPRLIVFTILAHFGEHLGFWLGLA